MSTRYIVDAEGRPVEAILNLDDLRTMLEAHHELAHATQDYQEVMRRHQWALEMA